MSNLPAVAALQPVAQALERLGVSYHVGGSLASSVHGVGRSTADVDIVADLHVRHVQEFVRQLQSAYYLDEAAVLEAIQTRRSFNLIHLATMVKVDVFAKEQTPFASNEMARAQPRALDVAPGARTFPVTSPEDIVLRKLLWYRAGGEVSERQWNDVQGVLKLQGTALDRAYMQHWAAQLGIGDLLERAVREVRA